MNSSLSRVIMLMCLLFTSCSSHEEDASESGAESTIVLMGDVAPRLDSHITSNQRWRRVSIRVRDNQWTCTPPESEATRMLCRTKLWGRPPRFQIHIEAVGYQSLVRNIPAVEYKHDTAVVNVGLLELMPDPVRIRSIIEGTEGDSAYRFLIFIQNDLNRTTSIRGIELGFTQHTSCLDAPRHGPHEFRLSSRMRFQLSPDSGAVLAGSIVERRSRPEMQIPIIGSFYHAECGASRFNLAARVDEDVPAKATYVLDLIIPYRLSVRGVTLPSERANRDPSLLQRLRTGEMGWPVSAFDGLELRMRINSREVTELVAPLNLPELENPH
jgi:hypothetical protein